MKKNLLLFLIIGIYIQTNAQIPNDDVARYYFDASSLVNIASPGDGDLVSTGTNFGFTTNRFGVNNEALNTNQDAFDGYTLIASNGSPINGVSVSLWHLFNGAVAASPTNNETIFEFFDSSNNGLRVYKAAAGWGIEMVHNGTTYNTSIQSSTNPELIDGNSWHNIIITINATAGDFLIDAFLDGIQIGTSGTTGFTSNINWITGNARFKLSPRYPGSNTSLRSAVDDIRLYRNKAINPTEAGALFNEASSSGLSRIYVDNQNGNDNNSGDSWVNAIRSINLGVDRTSINGELWIAGGTYTPAATDRVASFDFGKGITAYGGFDGTEVNLSDRVLGPTPTILSGDLLGNDTSIVSDTNTSYGENSVSVVKLDSNATLDGFTISNGFASGVTNGPVAEGNGAAIFIPNSTNITEFTIKNCIIERNVSKLSGTIYIVKNNGTDVTIENCIFRNNFTRLGAGLFCLTSGVSQTHNVSILSSLFYENDAANTTAGGAAGFGSSTVIINDSRNSIGTSIGTTMNVEYINNTFVDNTETGTGYTQGAGSYATNIVQNLQGNFNVTFHNNLSFNNTRGSNATQQSPLANYASTGPAIVFDVQNNLNTETWGNVNGAPFSSIQNTVTSAPTFVNASSNDYRLTATSQGVDQGRNGSVSTNHVSDLDGEVRIENTTVDIGAYEFGSTTLSIDRFNDDLNDLSLFPNPVKNQLYIQSKDTIGLVEIYAITGRKVLETNLSTVNVSALQAGIYILKVNNKTTRFIKQ